MAMMETKKDPGAGIPGNSVKYSSGILPLLNEKKYPALICPSKFDHKPTGDELGQVTNWCKSNAESVSLYSVSELFDAFTHGKCVIPAEVKLSKDQKFAFVSANYICVDIDDTAEMTDPLATFYHLLPAGMFYTFSHGLHGKGNRYRLFYILDRTITDSEEYMLLSDALCSELRKKGLNADKRPPIIPMRTGIGEPKINENAKPLNADHYISIGKEMLSDKKTTYAEKGNAHCNFSTEQIREMIEAIGPMPTGSAPYNEWIRVCVALKNMSKFETEMPDGSTFTDEEGRELCDYICDGERDDSFWDYQLQADGQSSVGTIYYIAKKYGWKPTAPVSSPEDDFSTEAGLDLERNRAHNIRPIASNFRKILDYFFPGYFAFDIFSDSLTVLQKLPWNSDAVPRCWNDNDDHCLRTCISETFDGLDKPDVLRSTLIAIAMEHRFHPVRDYLNPLKWDGIPRVDTWPIDYFGAADTPYTRAVARKCLVACVARVMHPGIKFDYMTILQGKPRIGKSTFLQKIGRKWFDNTRNTFKNKDDRQMIQGLWIYEAQELEGFSAAGINSIKAFMSTASDRYRSSYGRNTTDHPRQCVFFGSTNDDDFLRDRTGNRKFWTIACGVTKPIKSVFTDLTDNEIDQIWAEAMADWKNGEKIYLPSELEAEAEKVQAQFTEDDARESLIEDFLEKQIPEDWYSRKMLDQRGFINGSEVNPGKLVKRDRVNALEIWCLCFDGTIEKMDKRARLEMKDINRIMSHMTGWRKKEQIRCGIYGKKRGYKRIEEEDK